MNLKKLHISLTANNDKKEYNLLGKYDGKTISYHESEKLRSKLILDIENRVLTKENIDYKITLNFNTKSSNNEIFLKKEDKVLKLELETIKYEVNDSKIEIKYKIVDSNEIIEYIIEIGE